MVNWYKIDQPIILLLYVIATQPPTKPQLLAQPLAQLLALFAIFRGQNGLWGRIQLLDIIFFGKLINFVSYHFFKLFVIYWSFYLRLSQQV